MQGVLSKGGGGGGGGGGGVGGVIICVMCRWLGTRAILVGGERSFSGKEGYGCGAEPGVLPVPGGVWGR